MDCRVEEAEACMRHYPTGVIEIDQARVDLSYSKGLDSEQAQRKPKKTVEFFDWVCPRVSFLSLLPMKTEEFVMLVLLLIAI